MSGGAEASAATRDSWAGAFLLWAAYLALDTASQLAFKSASGAVGAGALDLAWFTRAVMAPSLWAGVACYIGTLVIWMRVLARMDLSRAFPISGLSYVTVPALAIPLFDESLAPFQVVGIVAICAGVALLALEREHQED